MKQWQKSNMGKAVAKVKQYKLAKIKRTPMWADKEAIERMYIISDFLTNKLDEPHHVDHIIPLRGDFVSGLHCESNLQILTAEANRAKGNRINLGEL
jgi:5-methylcytosine-specific restriction endonuclease McrA